MKKHIVIKELPDANIGTEVIWDETQNCFYYEKSAYVSPYNRTFLTAGQVTQTPKFFCAVENHPEYFAFNNPVYSRKEVLDILKQSFPNRQFSGEFSISASKQINDFETLLRKIGIENAKTLLLKK